VDWIEKLGLPLATALLSGCIALIVARFQAERTAESAIRARQRDLSIEVTKLLLDSRTREAAARRFAVGVAKVVTDPRDSDVRGTTLFVPINSRVTIGRDPSNDIVLPHITVSRFHCGLVSEGQKVFVENYGSHNGLHIGDRTVEIGESVLLANGDLICFVGYELRYSDVHCSSVYFL
jgi:hypothetical protein